jgi:hypothetical protein
MDCWIANGKQFATMKVFCTMSKIMPPKKKKNTNSHKYNTSIFCVFFLLHQMFQFDGQVKKNPY